MTDAALAGRPALRPSSPAPAPETVAGRLRIVIHDYAGHAFPVQLSRWLARQGHAVLHLYSADIETPRGRLCRDPADPPGFAIEGLSTGRPVAKYDLIRRWFQEMAYGRRLRRHAAAFRPDVVLSGNAPPAVQAALCGGTRRARVPLVCWVQDIFTPGAAEILRNRPKLLRRAACRFLERVEFGAMRAAAGLVVISPDFVPVLAAHGVRHPRCTVIENWAPYGEITARPKDNAWARRHGLAGRFVFLCSGTLGLKHDPAPLAHLARAFRDDPEIRVAVVSQGPGRRRLEAEKARDGLDNLHLFDFQPFEDLPEVLACADVSVVLLEDYAGALSVPSKVYSYFCAERAILGAVPAANLARRLIEEQQAGLCVDPADTAGFLAAARRLRQDAGLRADLAGHQAAFAARAFDIERIGPRFLAVLEEACRLSG